MRESKKIIHKPNSPPPPAPFASFGVGQLFGTVEKKPTSFPPRDTNFIGLRWAPSIRLS